MAQSFTNIVIVGRLTQDPSVRTIQGQNGPITFATLRVAVDRPYNSKRGENGEILSDFWTIDLKGNDAMYAQNAVKGQLVAARGWIMGDKYVTKDGVQKDDAKIQADFFQILSGKPNQQGQAGAQQQPPQQNGGYNNAGGGYNNAGGGYQNQSQMHNNQQQYGGYQNQQPPMQQQPPQQYGGYQNQQPPMQQQPPQNQQPPMPPPQYGNEYGVPEGFTPVDDDPFGLGGGAPNGY